MNKLKNLYIFILVVVVPIFVLYQSCGISKPRYIEYDDDQTTGTATAGDGGNAAAAIALFSTKVQPVIDSTCGTASCHGGGSAGSLTLTVGGDEANRAALKTFSNDAQVIFNKISSATHGGGNQSEKLPLAVLQEWLTAEANTGGEEAGADPEECPPELIFLAQIQPAIAKSCAGCHGIGAGGGLTLSNGNENAPANRAALFDATGTVDELFNKISLTGKTHAGGDRSGDLPKANIELWMAEEYACK